MGGAMIRSRDPIWRNGAGGPGKETRQKAVNFGEKTAALENAAGRPCFLVTGAEERRAEEGGDAAAQS